MISFSPVGMHTKAGMPFGTDLYMPLLLTLHRPVSQVDK